MYYVLVAKVLAHKAGFQKFKTHSEKKQQSNINNQ